MYPTKPCMLTVIWHGQGAIRIAIFDDKISIAEILARSGSERGYRTP